MAVLTARELVKIRTDTDGRDRTILDAVSLTLEPASVVALLGPSGGGKSTLLRLLNRLEEPDRGMIQLDGQDLHQLNPLDVRCRVSLVPQKPYLFPGTVLENLQYGYVVRKVKPPSADAPVWRDTLALCGVGEDLLGQVARKLSVGQQQRVCLARALMGGSECLLLDEPTSALDPPTAARLAKTFRQLARERRLALLVVSHDLAFIRAVADQVLFMTDGRVLESGSKDKLFQSPESRELKSFLDAEEGRT